MMRSPSFETLCRLLSPSPDWGSSLRRLLIQQRGSKMKSPKKSDFRKLLEEQSACR